MSKIYENAITKILNKNGAEKLAASVAKQTPSGTIPFKRTIKTPNGIEVHHGYTDSNGNDVYTHTNEDINPSEARRVEGWRSKKERQDANRNALSGHDVADIENDSYEPEHQVNHSDITKNLQDNPWFNPYGKIHTPKTTKSKVVTMSTKGLTMTQHLNAVAKQHGLKKGSELTPAQRRDAIASYQQHEAFEVWIKKENNLYEYAVVFEDEILDEGRAITENNVYNLASNFVIKTVKQIEESTDSLEIIKNVAKKIFNK